MRAPRSTRALLRRLGVRIGGGGCARVQHAHPTRGSRSCTVPARLLRVTRDMAAEVRNAPCRAHSGRARQRWLGFPIRALNTRKEGGLKRTTTGGRAEQGFKHRARDAGEMADLRSFRTRLHRKASSRLSAARRSGLRVRSGPRRPAPPSLSTALRPSNLGRKSRRENGSGWLRRDDDTTREQQTLLCSPPPCGEGLGVGVDDWGMMDAKNFAPHPDALRASTLPLKGEGKTERVERPPLSRTPTPR